MEKYLMINLSSGHMHYIEADSKYDLDMENEIIIELTDEVIQEIVEKNKGE